MNKSILISYFVIHAVFLQAQDQNSLLWKIEGKNADHTSYVFGTMHSEDKRIFNLDSALVPLVLKSDLYVPEADLHGGLNYQKVEKLILPEGKTLKDFYSEEEYEFIAREFERRSSKSIEDMLRLQPLALLMFLEKSSPYYLPLSLDDYLYGIARSEGIEIHGLETVEEQISFGIKSQNIKHVLDYFKNSDKFDSLADELRLAYIAEDHQAILRISRDSSITGFDMNVLLDERNQIMITRMDSITLHRKAFFAIGAGHLFGENGILEGLRKLGHEVTPVRNKKKMHQLVAFDISWQDYKSSNNNFTVKFPNQPEVTESIGDNVYTADFIQNGVMSMTFSVNEKINRNFKPMDTEAMSKMLLFRIRSGFAKNLGFTPQKSKYLLYHGRSALETLFSLDNSEMLVHSRFILAEGKLYVLFVLVKPNTEDLESIEKFMNSFTILN